MSKPSQIIALLLALGILIVAGAALALSRTKIVLPIAISKPTPSTFAGRVSLTATSRDYLVLTIIGSYSDPIRISGWTLESAGASTTIPEGTALLRQGVVNTQQPIILYPGEGAIISFGTSPVGTSFRVNTCSSLLEKFQPFTPPLTDGSSVIEKGFYNDCVFTHKSDTDFYKGQWRIFTSSSSSLLSGEHGTLVLRDENKLPVATLSY